MNKRIRYSRTIVLLTAAILASMTLGPPAQSVATGFSAPTGADGGPQINTSAMNAAASPRLTPADLPDSTPVTINVTPVRAPAGQSVTISGLGAPAGAQVRLAAVINGSMLGLQDVTADATGAYASQMPIGDTYPPGQVQLCAFGLESEKAEVACVDFIVDAPPNGSFTGRVPITALDAANVVPRQAAIVNAEMRLLNAAGVVKHSTPLKPDGSFVIPDVAPGVYQYAVAGTLPKLAEMGTVTIESATAKFLDVAVLEGCNFLHPNTTALSANPSRAGFIAKSSGGGLFLGRVSKPRPFGLYVKGVNNPVTFTASPQGTGPVQKVIFDVRGLNNQSLAKFEDDSLPFEFTYNVGGLPVSQQGSHPYVYVTPVVNGKVLCSSTYEIEVVADPMASFYMQPGYSRTTWDGASKVYNFEGIVPYITTGSPDYDPLLPLEDVLARDVPYLGTIKNKFNAGLGFKGLFDLEGKARIFMAEAVTEAEFLSFPVLDPDSKRFVTPPGFGQVLFDIRDPSRLAIPYGPIELYKDDLFSVPFAKIPVFSFFGIVNAYVTGQMTFGIGLYLEGNVRPLVPAIDTTLKGVGSFKAELGLSVDVLLGLGEAGMALGGEVCAVAPLRVVVPSNRPVFFDDPYVGGRLYLAFTASAFWGVVKTRKEVGLHDFGRGCPGSMLAASQNALSEPNIPDVFVSPAVATSPGGRVLSAYVQNTAAPGETPRVQVMARFQDPNTGIWSNAQAVSNPAHSARSPSVAFIGGNQTPMIVWAENTLTADEAAAIGEDDGEQDASAHLRHQEIFYTTWNDSWRTPIALTSDNIGDGMPESAGSLAGGLIAWTRDTDGDAATRSDQRIAVYILGSRVINEPILLGAPGMNTDVSVTYDHNGVPIVAWVHDADGDLTTGGDRRIQVATSPFNTYWTQIDTLALPARADSPTVSAGPEGIRVAFLVREPSADGNVAVVGTNGVLWSALYANGTWNARRVTDVSGKNVYAEQPELKRSSVGSESLLVFRRFGEETHTSGLGQLGLSRMTQSAIASSPIYLTDGPRQQWLPALAISPITNKAIVLHSSLSGVSSPAGAQSLTTQASIQPLASTTVGSFDAGANTVSVLVIDDAADPALDPLQVSNDTPAPGQTVNVTLTVRNVGRGATTGLTRIMLYRGSSANGILIDGLSLPQALGFNQTATLVYPLSLPDDLGPTGKFLLTAHMFPSGQNTSLANDIASIELGGLSAPGRVELVGENAEFAGALDLVWSGNTNEYVTGYRVYRSDTLQGPWSLVGESAVPSFTDTSAELRKTYCYRLQAYNSQKALSPFSVATCSAFMASQPAVFLPVVSR